MRHRLIGLLVLVLLLTNAGTIFAQQHEPDRLVPLAELPPKPPPPPPNHCLPDWSANLIQAATAVNLPHGGVHLEWLVDATCPPDEIHIFFRPNSNNDWYELPHPLHSWTSNGTTEWGSQGEFMIDARWNNKHIGEDFQTLNPFGGFDVTPFGDGQILTWHVGQGLEIVPEWRFSFNITMKTGPGDNDWTYLTNVPLAGEGKYLFLDNTSRPNVLKYRLVFWDHVSGDAFEVETEPQQRMLGEPWVTVPTLEILVHEPSPGIYLNLVTMGVGHEDPAVSYYIGDWCSDNFPDHQVNAAGLAAYQDSVICHTFVDNQPAEGPGSFYYFSQNLPSLPTGRYVNAITAVTHVGGFTYSRLVGYGFTWAPTTSTVGSTYLPMLFSGRATPEPPPPLK